MVKFTVMALASWVVVGGAAFAASSTSQLTASRAEVASAVTDACRISQSECLSAIRTWITAAAECRKDADQTESCVCTRRGLEVAWGLGDAALFIRASDIALSGMIAAEVAEGAPGCFAGAFALITNRDEGNGGTIGSAG